MSFLQNAQEADPKNYSVGLDLAMLYRTAMPASADIKFEQLLAEHPAKGNETALLWLDALVMPAEFKNILLLAETQLKADSVRRNTWAKALIFSSRQLHATPELKKLLADRDEKLNPWRACLKLEIALQERNQDEVNSLLRQPWEKSEPAYASFHKLLEMAKNRRGIGALDMLQEHQSEFDPAAKAILVLATLSELKMASRLAAQVDLLLASQGTPDAIKMLCAHVVRYRDRATFRRAYAKAVETDPRTAHTEMWFSLLCAAGAAKDAPAIKEIATRLRGALGSSSLATAIQNFFAGESNQQKFSGFLPWLGLSREENYALLENPPLVVTADRNR